MASTGRRLGAALLSMIVSGACRGNDDECDVGVYTRCDEQSGPLSVRYCRRDRTWSECTPEVNCNPLTQDGCEDGLACYYEYPWTFCTPAELFPCEPGEFFGGTGDGEPCNAHCAHDGRDGVIFDAPECDEDEWCYPISSLEGVGMCAIRDSEA